MPHAMTSAASRSLTTKPEQVLPIELIRKYEADSFWLDPARNPYHVKVV